MQKTGRLELTWVGKYDEKNIEPRILLEDQSKSYGDLSSGNMLIHGDNLIALQALQQDFAGKIKCIYIDPPYNTGSAFDYYDDGLEHSEWLQMIYPRVQLLHELLADDGFMCCHIDDSESHYLKCLLDEVFGRANYLTSFYVQVRYPNKTLAEDSDYQKVIEQVLIYAKDRYKAKVNRPTEEYSIEKFIWKVNELSAGTEVELGNKKVVIFQPNEYEIVKEEPSYTGLKETWATGSLSRVKASAGEFFELYLSSRKELDGLGCLYKVYGIGEDGLGYRYISGPKKATANKGKFYSGIPLNRLEELKTGSSLKHRPVSNFYDFAGGFGNCRLEGGVGFKGGKKPEALLKMILEYFSNEGDWVLDSFLGSGSTMAVAHKMNRKWIGVEMGEHAYSLCKVRIDNVINGDKTGISKEVEWQGGGGYHFYELAPSLLVKNDKLPIYQINPSYTFEMLCEAICKIEGFRYKPQDVFHGHSSEKRFIHITAEFINAGYIKSLSARLAEGQSLLIYGTKIQSDMILPDNIEVKKIPKDLLEKCNFESEVQ